MLPRILRPGDWRPAAGNLSLLVIQLINLWQAFLRGTEYLRTPDRPPAPATRPDALAVVEQSASLTTWGALMVGSVALVLIGLTGRWAGLVIAGHVLLAAWYVGLGVGVLQAIGTTGGWSTALGVLLSIAGAWVVFHPDHDPDDIDEVAWWRILRRMPPMSTGLRILIGIPAMIVGQPLLLGGLDPGYRSGTGLIAAGLVHLTLAVGTFVLITRQRLDTVADEAIARGEV